MVSELAKDPVLCPILPSEGLPIGLPMSCCPLPVIRFCFFAMLEVDEERSRYKLADQEAPWWRKLGGFSAPSPKWGFDNWLPDAALPFAIHVPLFFSLLPNSSLPTCFFCFSLNALVSVCDFLIFSHGYSFNISWHGGSWRTPWPPLLASSTELEAMTENASDKIFRSRRHVNSVKLLDVLFVVCHQPFQPPYGGLWLFVHCLLMFLYVPFCGSKLASPTTWLILKKVGASDEEPPRSRWGKTML